ncbi:MAG TPA: efflux transporter outer membrane subunit [Terracidiphilus sp.]|nr:efflux transporter outer membrane subunit [Terracidiphilus sp.]
MAPSRYRRRERQALNERLLVGCLLGLVALLAGCKVGPNYQRPDTLAPPDYKEGGSAGAVVPPTNPAGGTWKPASPSDGMLRGKWWEAYQDPQLNALEEQIAPQNQNLRAASEAYLSARDQVRVARADFYPTLSVTPAASRDQVSSHRPLIVNSTQTAYSDFQLEGQASWEPDLWGRVRRNVEAAHENAQASAADLANVDLSLHAELALDYFELRGLDSDARLLTKAVSDFQNQLDLNQKLVKGGLATEVVVAQALTQLETTRAQLVDVNEARNEFEHAIATLINKEARDVSLAPTPLDLALPKIPVGVPSQLIERRPDIAAVERRTAAANAQIGIAISAFYPNVVLGGGGGFESTNVGTLIQGPSALWSLGAQATELLFDAGKRHAITDQARHNYEAEASTYRATVLGAFNEVEDRMSDLRVLEEESVTEQRAVAAAQHSLDLSNQRYKGGATSYLEVLIADNTLLTNQRTSTDLVTRQFAASVGLVRALGGGWDVTQLPH